MGFDVVLGVLLQIFYFASAIFSFRLHIDVEGDRHTMKWQISAGMIAIIVYSYALEAGLQSCQPEQQKVGLCLLFIAFLWVFFYPFVLIVAMALGRALSKQFSV